MKLHDEIKALCHEIGCDNPNGCPAWCCGGRNGTIAPVDAIFCHVSGLIKSMDIAWLSPAFKNHCIFALVESFRLSSDIIQYCSYSIPKDEFVRVYRMLTLLGPYLKKQEFIMETYQGEVDIKDYINELFEDATAIFDENVNDNND